MSDQRERSRYTPDAQHTVCIRRKPWNSPPATVRTSNARTMVNAASALIWSVVGPTAAFLGCCVPGVRAPFRRVRGTAYFGGRGEEPHDTIAMRALAEGHSLRGTGRLVEIDKDTVCDWLERAGRHGRA